jgi:hypothetical protein
MTHHRRNDPLGLSDSRNVATDPERIAVGVAEFRRKLQYLEDGYWFDQQAGLNNREFNASLAFMKRAIAHKLPPGTRKTRLHPELELLVNLEIRKLAGLPYDAPLDERKHSSFAKQAGINIAKRETGRRGVQGNPALRRVVEGLMAAFQESTKQPVMGPRDKDSVYEPHLTGSGGRIIRAIIDHLKPGVPDTTLALWVRQLRKKYASKPMRFRDIFPGYGATVDPKTGTPVGMPPYEIKQLMAVVPIYCPSQPS